MAGEYFDVVLLGRAGQGKTTLANKLLDVKKTDPFKIQVFQPVSEQIGKKCELTSNEVTKLLVVDVPGFSGFQSEYATLQNNFHIIKNLGQVLEEFQLHVKRVVYFLPARGPLEKADGSLQEELKLLNVAFGKDIFDRMLVVATQSPLKKYQSIGFEYADIQQTSTVFHTALKNAVSEDIACPPVLYAGFNDSPEETLHQIQNTLVLNDGTFPLRIKADFYLRYPNQVDLATEGTRGGNQEVMNAAPRLVVRTHPVPKFLVNLLLWGWTIVCYFAAKIWSVITNRRSIP